MLLAIDFAVAVDFTLIVYSEPPIASSCVDTSLSASSSSFLSSFSTCCARARPIGYAQLGKLAQQPSTMRATGVCGRGARERTLRGGRSMETGVGCRSHRSATLFLSLSSLACSCELSGKTGRGANGASSACCWLHESLDLPSRRMVSLYTCVSKVVVMTAAHSASDDQRLSATKNGRTGTARFVKRKDALLSPRRRPSASCHLMSTFICAPSDHVFEPVIFLLPS